jgi:lipopolysaccharide assembly outer membrane protein LptD (OstA)
MRISKLILVLTCLFCAFGSSLWAEEGPKEKPRDIQFSADTVDYDEGQQRIRLVGNVIISSDGSKLTAPYAVYFTEKEYAEFLGGVKMVGEQSTATGKEMRVWYGEKKARLEGSVRLISQKGGDGESKEPTVILSETLDYNWETEEGVASGGVKMRQGQKRAFADRAEVYQKRNEVLLLGNVRIEQGDGDWLTAQRAIYDTEKQTVRAEGRVVAKTRLDQKKAEPPEPGTAGPAKASLPQPLLVEPGYELLPMRRLPSVPLPWLDQEE